MDDFREWCAIKLGWKIERFGHDKVIYWTPKNKDGVRITTGIGPTFNTTDELLAVCDVVFGEYLLQRKRKRNDSWFFKFVVYGDHQWIQTKDKFFDTAAEALTAALDEVRKGEKIWELL